MGVYKNFVMYTRADDGLEKFLNDLEDSLGSPLDIHSHDIAFDRKTKQDILNLKSDKDNTFWIADEGNNYSCFLTVYPEKDSASLVKLYSYGSAEFTYSHLFQPFMDTASRYGHSAICGTSEKPRDTWYGIPRMEIAYDSPGHMLMNQDYQKFMNDTIRVDEFGKPLSYSRTKKVRSSNPEVDMSDIEMQTRHGFSRSFG